MSEQEQDGSSSVDSELAALLDEELFHDDPAEAAEQQEEADMAEAAATAQADHSEQQAKRARWTQQQQPGASDDGADSVEDMSEGSEGVGAAVTAVAAQQEEYVCPPHPGWWQGLCIRCGAERRADEPEARHQQHAAAHNASRAPRVKIRHLSNKQPLEIAAHEAARIASDDRQKLVAQRRMVLVLDLDHTLLNTVRDNELVGEEREVALKLVQAEEEAWQQHMQTLWQQQQQGLGQPWPQQQQEQQEQEQPPAAAGAEASGAGNEGGAADAGSAGQQQQEQPPPKQEQQQEEEGSGDGEADDDPWDNPSGAAAAAEASAGGGGNAAAAAADGGSAEAGVEAPAAAAEAAAGAAAEGMAVDSTAAPAAGAGGADLDLPQQQQQQGGEQQQQQGVEQQQPQGEPPVSGAGATIGVTGSGVDVVGAAGGSSVSAWPGYGPKQQFYWFKDKNLWTKLRPGVGAFLKAVSELYELHIYTMGDKNYARLMADVLDPEHRLFVGRVISIADMTYANEKVKDLDVVMADESLVVILDDSEWAWPRHRANLIQMERYHFFGASIAALAPDKKFSGTSRLLGGMDEPLQGGMLDTAQQLLTRLHERVFDSSSSGGDNNGNDNSGSGGSRPSSGGSRGSGVSETQQQQQDDAERAESSEQQQQQQQQAAAALPGIRRVVRRPNAQQQQQQQQAAAAAGGGNGGGGNGGSSGVLLGHKDVRECLRQERRSVLQDCCIVFSRCWPQDFPHSTHILWRLAESLGATCSLKIQAGRTTHLVVPPVDGQLPLTDKVQAAKQAGVAVVHPDWLLACMFAWKQLPAPDFALGHYNTVAGSPWCTKQLLGPPRNRVLVEEQKMAVLRSAGRVGP